ncbi:imidazole glycerol phosphate synthase subunit HisF [Actinomyces sp.]|uniref:imidazole glycerol phosphate synthase subunit HisF n=1 Tax=Actinomyces sp. TaxID=29317 RepID=UPI001ECAE020|nr:imidazole glycerol phosphate synthase subunit HisF [Actinomyces sp.]MBS5826178.1 imidazole glycerol phosphate synthase subunit HisF [Actinomyces sp.]MDU5231342.1 imidazole glycerol phosphate synthase subunit HisF [Actinomyces sp.]MDU6757088.1 imidazole glycerol phosphate synthase subunit HisF [Actinomyces sp.]
MNDFIKVIPCLDVKNGRVVKGVNFVHLKDAGDPAQLASAYVDAGADELTFLDISATTEGRDTMVDLVAKVASLVSIPFAVGGGIRNVEDAQRLFEAGVDKVSVNSAAIDRPDVLDELAQRFGTEKVILALDARRCADGVSTPSGYEVTTHGGSKSTGIDAVGWAKDAAARGVGEILLTSMDADGVQTGFDLDLLRAIRAAVDVPITASGGAGEVEHFVEAARAGANAVLAASVFHFGKVSIAQVKSALADAGFKVSGKF